LPDVGEVKRSACELIRLKKSGVEATADDNKPADEVKQRGPAMWPGDLTLHLLTYISMFFYYLSSLSSLLLSPYLWTVVFI